MTACCNSGYCLNYYTVFGADLTSFLGFPQSGQSNRKPKINSKGNYGNVYKNLKYQSKFSRSHLGDSKKFAYSEYVNFCKKIFWKFETFSICSF